MKPLQFPLPLLIIALILGVVFSVVGMRLTRTLYESNQLVAKEANLPKNISEALEKFNDDYKLIRPGYALILLGINLTLASLFGLLLIML